jgi:acyl-CoA thioester hydrolase
MNRDTSTAPEVDLAPCTAGIPPAGLVPHERPFAAALRVGEEHTSSVIPHVSNVQFVRWLDRAAELHGEAAGYGRQRLLSDGCMWFVARHEIDYRAEAHPGEELTVLTWVRDIAHVKSWRESVILRPADETVVCRAATLWVLVDLASRRPRRVPPWMRRVLDPLTPPEAVSETGG